MNSKPVCQNCGLVFRSTTMSWRGGQLFWSLLPDDRAKFATGCDYARHGDDDSTVWCPAMRTAFEGNRHPRPAEALSNAEVMERFINLGDNCEVGLAQRWGDCEPIDLLRFANFRVDVTETLAATTRALAARFVGLGEPNTVRCEPKEEVSGEYFIYDDAWGLQYHTGIKVGEMPLDKLLAAEVKMLRLKHRKLLREMAEGRRIFVWKSNTPPPEADIRALLAVLRRDGPNRLLWGLPTDPDHPAGTVEDVGGGLLKGYVTRFAPYEAALGIDPNTWIGLCRNVLMALSGSGPSDTARS